MVCLHAKIGKSLVEAEDFIAWFEAAFSEPLDPSETEEACAIAEVDRI